VKPTTLKKCALCIFGSLIYHILVSASPHVREEDENQHRKLACHFEIERMHFKNMSPIRHYLALAKAQGSFNLVLDLGHKGPVFKA
jgi:hypothetical protein